MPDLQNVLNFSKKIVCSNAGVKHLQQGEINHTSNVINQEDVLWDVIRFCNCQEKSLSGS